MAIIKNPQMLAINKGEGWDGKVLNGAIEKYLATSGTIDANTFVKIINKDGEFTHSSETALFGSTGYVVNGLKAVALSETRVLVIYRLNPNSSYWYGVVCTIDGDKITAGAQVELGSINDDYDSLTIDMVALDDSRAFLCYYKYGSSPTSYSYYGVVLTINGDSITTGTATSLYQLDYSFSSQSVAVALLEKDKVFVAYSVNGTQYGLVCTIDGSKITKGTSTILLQQNGRYLVGIIALSNTKVYITIFGSYTDARPGDIVCTINGTSVTKGTFTYISQAHDYRTYSLTALDSSRVVETTWVSPNIVARINQVNGTIITVGNNIAITATEGHAIAQTRNHIDLAPIIDQKMMFFIYIYASGSSYYLHGLPCFIQDNGANITTGTSTKIASISGSTGHISACKINDSKVFVTCGTGYVANGVLCDFTKTIASATSNTFDGLTKTRCATTAPGEVWVWGNPYVPTLQNLKKALTRGDAESLFPTGTEIPDTYAGNDNPLIVGIYETVDSKLRVGLVRKYAEPIAQQFDAGGVATYPDSTIFNFLQNEYLNNCSDDLKETIAEVKVPYYINGLTTQVKGKWQLLSAVNVMGVANQPEASAWGYWKNATGLSSANNDANNGRIRTGTDGTACAWWLYDWYSPSDVYIVTTKGAVINYGAYGGKLTSTMGVLPACYITAG